MPKLIRLIERFTAVTGHTIRWLSLLMVILVCMVVFMRYFLGMPSVVLQESVQYLHAMLFMLGIAYTWQKDAHVDRKSTRLNSTHVRISYAVFCLKKKK